MGHYVTSLWWGGDPDKPDAVSGLTLRDIHNVQCSWAPVYAQSGIYGMEMFLRLFDKDPSTKAFFKAIRNLNVDEIRANKQFRAHVANLMGSIHSCVVNLNEPDVVAALMKKLGKSHHRNLVEKAHFEDFKEIWIETLAKDLNVNEKTMASWKKFIDFMYKHIYKMLIDVS